MRIFVDEFLTSGGLLSHGWMDDAASLAREGAAMVSALAEDFARMDGASVTVKRDYRLKHISLPGCQVVEIGSAEEERSQFDRLAAEADWTLVIAPECGGLLAERCQRVMTVGGRLLGGGIDLIRLASDKHL